MYLIYRTGVCIKHVCFMFIYLPSSLSYISALYALTVCLVRSGKQSTLPRNLFIYENMVPNWILLYTLGFLNVPNMTDANNTIPSSSSFDTHKYIHRALYGFMRVCRH